MHWMSLYSVCARIRSLRDRAMPLYSAWVCAGSCGDLLWAILSEKNLCALHRFLLCTWLQPYENSFRFYTTVYWVVYPFFHRCWRELLPAMACVPELTGGVGERGRPGNHAQSGDDCTTLQRSVDRECSYTASVDIDRWVTQLTVVSILKRSGSSQDIVQYLWHHISGWKGTTSVHTLTQSQTIMLRELIAWMRSKFVCCKCSIRSEWI